MKTQRGTKITVSLQITQIKEIAQKNAIDL